MCSACNQRLEPSRPLGSPLRSHRVTIVHKTTRVLATAVAAVALTACGADQVTAPESATAPVSANVAVVDNTFDTFQFTPQNASKPTVSWVAATRSIRIGAQSVQGSRDFGFGRADGRGFEKLIDELACRAAGTENAQVVCNTGLGAAVKVRDGSFADARIFGGEAPSLPSRRAASGADAVCAVDATVAPSGLPCTDVEFSGRFTGGQIRYRFPNATLAQRFVENNGIRRLLQEIDQLPNVTIGAL